MVASIIASVQHLFPRSVAQLQFPYTVAADRDAEGLAVLGDVRCVERGAALMELLRDASIGSSY